MWPRKQIDIGWADLAWGISGVLLSRSRPDDHAIVSENWFPSREALICLSVRSGWDLLLAALALPPGAQVLMSAVTVPDMARIVQHHGLAVVQVAVDPDTLAPAAGEIERAITPQTRIILIAHLFGARVEMGPIIEIARARGILVVEDAAQAYEGPGYAGHEGADVCMFSFGPIKTATALGGAIVRVGDADLHERMARRQAQYPLQSRLSYLRRLIKYAAARVIMIRPVYGALVRCCGVTGIDFDRRFQNLSHSFAPERLFELIRRRPCAPLLHMLQRRINDPRIARAIALRTDRGRRFVRALPPECAVGRAHMYWVLPIRVGNREAAIVRLREAGFDATGLSSLVVVSPEPDSRPEPAGASARCKPHWLEEVIFLPNGAAIPESELDRMAAILASELGAAAALEAQSKSPPMVSAGPGTGGGGNRTPVSQQPQRRPLHA